MDVRPDCLQPILQLVFYMNRCNWGSTNVKPYRSPQLQSMEHLVLGPLKSQCTLYVWVWKYHRYCKCVHVWDWNIDSVTSAWSVCANCLIMILLLNIVKLMVLVSCHAWEIQSLASLNENAAVSLSLVTWSILRPNHCVLPYKCFGTQNVVYDKTVQPQLLYNLG